MLDFDKKRALFEDLVLILKFKALRICKSRDNIFSN